MNPKVSIIVPVYNVEEYLKECLDSIVNQSFKDIEIICVDDGSTDGSLAILKDYEEQDDRIIVISQENHGVGKARNVGLKKAVGDYILFVDSDDWIYPDAIELLYSNAFKNNSDMVNFKYTYYPNLDRDGNAWGFDFRPNFDKVTDFTNLTFNYKQIKNHVLNSFLQLWIQLIKREFLESYDDFYFPENVAYEDVLFHVKLFLRAKRISYIPKVFYFYRDNHNSIMHQSKYVFDIFKAIDSVKDFLIENDYYDEFKDEFDRFKIQHTLHYMICADSEEFFQKAKEEFSKINLSPNHIVDKRRLRLYELVLESSNYNQYLRGNFKIKEEEFKSQINSLNVKKSSLESNYMALNTKFKDLEKENDLLKKKNGQLNKKLNEYKSRKVVRFVDSIKSFKF